MAKKKAGKKKGDKSAAGKKVKSHANKDQEFTTAVTNAKLWAARVDIVEKSRSEYRSACHALARNNESLQDELQTTERDTIDVLSFFKQADLHKDERIIELESTLRTINDTKKNEKDALIAEFDKTRREKCAEIELKDTEIQLLQKELLQVKEFRHKKTMMQEQVESIKSQLYRTTLDHEQSVQNMERKFFDEKIKLEKEAGNRIAELAERAHSEAVKQLDITTRQVYQDNVRLTDALGKHIEENVFLRSENVRLTEENSHLKSQIETNDQNVKRKILETKVYKDKITTMNSEIATLQSDLSETIRSSKQEKQLALVKVSESNKELHQHANRLQRAFELQRHEMRKLRRAANKVLKQRSEVEEFLINAIDFSRNEIKASRQEYIKAIEHNYQDQMNQAFKGLAPYPKVTTFKKQLPHDKSTKSVYDNLAYVDEITESAEIDISEMTWEQREIVLRHLFAQINGLAKNKVQTNRLTSPVLPPIKSTPTREQDIGPLALFDDEENQKSLETTYDDNRKVSQDLADILKTDVQESNTFLTEVQE